MAVIECNEINQNINELLIAFQDCKKILNSDLRKLVDLVSAINTCANGGPNYNTLVTNTYEPITDQVVTYPINTFHSITIIVVSGTIIYNTFTFPSGMTQNIEVTTLNQTPITFTVKAGSKVLVEYLIETV
jgi:hypothetical protein